MNPLTEGKRIKLGYDYFATGFSGIQLSEAYYRLIAEKDKERLLFETATIDQMDEVYNPGDPCDENDRMTTEEMVMEAIRVQQFSRTNSKMAALVRVFNGYLNDKNIEAMEPVIGNPKKSGLFATVTVQIPFSDGQVVSIIFHSPEGNKMRIAADDEIIAFRWLLNKRDITHVVSPENDAEVSLQEIGKRTAQLVEKNSGRFQVMQKDLVEQKKNLENLKSSVDEAAKNHDELMAKLKEKQDSVEMMDAKIANLRDRIAKQQAFNEDLQNKIDALKAKQAANDGNGAQGGGALPPTVTRLNDGRTVLAKTYNGSLTAVTYSNKTQAYSAAEKLKTQGFNAYVTGHQPFYVTISAESTDDAVFEEKKAAFEQELAGRGFETDATGSAGTRYSFTYSSEGFVIKSDIGNKNGFHVGVFFNDGNKEEKTFRSATLSGLGAQTQKALAWIDKKLAGTKKEEKAAVPELNTLKEISDLPEGWSKGAAFDNRLNYGNGKYQISVMSLAEGDNAFRASLYEGKQVIFWKNAKMIDDANGFAVDMMRNAEALKAEYLSDIERSEPVAPSLDPTEPAAVSILNDIVDGKYGKDTKAIDRALDEAAEELEAKGLMEQYDNLLNAAADALTVILKEKAKGVAR